MKYHVNMKHEGVGGGIGQDDGEWYTEVAFSQEQAIARAKLLFNETFKVQPLAVIVVDMFGTVHARYGVESHPNA